MTPPDARPASPGALVVTEVPPRIEHLEGHAPFLRFPSGFSPRLYHFSSALAERRPLDVFAIHLDARDMAHPFCSPELAVRRYRPVLVGAPPTSRPGWAGRARTWWQFLFGTLPISCHPRRLREVEEFPLDDRPAVVVLYLPHLAHLVTRVAKGVPVVCALEEGWERFEALGVNQRDIGAARRAWINTTEGRRAAHLYRRVARRASAVVAISEREREWFARWIPPERIVVIPHGIDCEFFQLVPAAEEDIDVGVFGLLFQPRNADASAEVWRAAQDGAGAAWRWGFVGPPSDALARAVASPRSLLTGYVADVRPFYGRSKVVLAPAVSGTGVKTTVLQAWAMGKAVVATPHSVAGLPARPGENVLVGDTPADLVDHVSRLLASPELRSRLGDAGRQTVVQSRNMKDLAVRFAEVCDRAAATTAPEGRRARHGVNSYPHSGVRGGRASRT